MANRYWVGGTGNWSNTGGSVAMDSYSTTGFNALYLSSGDYLGAGQSFTGDGHTLASVVVQIFKSGSPTGNAVVKIYAHSGTFGTSSVATGAALATSDNFDVSTLTTSYASITFTFSGANQIVLTNGTYYVFTVEYTGGDGSNDIGVKTKLLGTHGGNSMTSLDLSTWNAISGRDFYFSVNYSIPGSWATTSGGTGGVAVPTSSDDVFIDANSGFGGGGTITLDGTAYCNNFITNSGHTYTITESGNVTLFFYGSLTLEAGITYSVNETRFAATTTGKTVTTNGVVLNSFLYVGSEGQGGSWTLQDSLVTTDEFYHENGTFDANGQNITANDFYFYADTGYTPTVIMGSGTWEATGSGAWYVDEYNGEVVTIVPETSTIKLTDSSASGKEFIGVNHEYYNLWLTGNGTGEFRIYDSNTFIEFKVDTPPHTIKFQSTKTTTVDKFTVSGTAGNLMTISMVGASGPAILSKPSGKVSCDYLDISNSTATGGATWYAGSHSANTANNNGWLFEDAPPPPRTLASTRTKIGTRTLAGTRTYANTRTKIIT